MYDIIIVGGGAAGLFCASLVNEIFPKDLRVLLLEKTASVGNKLLLSGSGQCNYTHAGEMKEFAKHYAQSYTFLKTALYQLSNSKLIEFFNYLGVESVVRDDLKVFPKSLRASDIKEALLNNAFKYPVELKTDCRLVNINHLNETIELVVIESDSEKLSLKTKFLVLCTGGASYYSTGSTGDIIRLLEKFSIKLRPFKPALSVPSLSYEYYNNQKNKPVAELSGICLNNATITLLRYQKKVLTNTGSILFTHRGLSGPLILDNSRFFQVGDVIALYLTQYTDFKEFEQYLIKQIDSNPKKIVKNVISILNIPDSIIAYLSNYLDISILTQKAAELSKYNRKIIAEIFFSMQFKIKNLGTLEQAMCSSGGIDLSEVNKNSMSLKKMSNIYLAGECLDVDADTGGFNIHSAFATANLAMRNISEKLLNK